LTVYFVPLLVTLRAQEQQQQPLGNAIDDDDASDGDLNEGCATMKPLGFGLDGFGAGYSTGTAANRDGQAFAGTGSELQVWGVRGPAEILGRVVEERLRDAGAQATAVLRACFASSCKAGSGSAGTGAVSDFETELLEASALLEFLQLARTTYEPGWQDDDV
jgi:hypothetical protein